MARSHILSPSVARGIAVMCAAVFVASAHTAQAGINVWTSHGPGVGGVTALAIDPITPRTLYAGTLTAASSRARTAATPGTRPTPACPTTPHVTALAIDPTTPSTLYAGTTCRHGGVFKSTDGGDTWNAANTGLPDDTAVSALAIDPTTPSTLYAGTSATAACSRARTAATPGARSTPACPTALTSPRSPSIPPRPARSTPGTRRRHAPASFKSTDGGSSWQAVNTGLPDTGVVALAIDPTTPSTLYAGTDGAGVVQEHGRRRHLERGQHRPARRAAVTALAIDPTTPSTLYAGTADGGVFKSTDGGGTWSAANTGLPDNRYVSALAIDPTTPSTLYAGTRTSRRVQEHGRRQQLERGQHGLAPATLTSPRSPSIPPRPARSTPGRQLRRRRVQEHGRRQHLERGQHRPARRRRPSPRSPSIPPRPARSTPGRRLRRGGVFKSTDGGGSWSAVNTGLPDTLAVHALAIDPTTPSTLYAGDGTATAAASFKSTDGGQQLERCQHRPARRSHVTALAIDPTTPSTLYAGTDGDGVFKSTDGAQQLAARSTPACPTTLSSPRSPSIPPRRARSTPGRRDGRRVQEHGRRRHLERGQHGPARQRHRLRARHRSHHAPHALRGATAGGVFKSTDGGSTWNALNTGLTNTYVYALAIDPMEPRRVYAGTERRRRVCD